jgi:hypothetical protein
MNESKRTIVNLAQILLERQDPNQAISEAVANIVEGLLSLRRMGIGFDESLEAIKAEFKEKNV